MIDELFVHNPIPMWTCDPASGQILAVNDAATRVYGYSREELLQMTSAYLEARDGAVLRGCAVRHRRKDRPPIEVELVRREVITDGRTLELVTVIDVSEREAARDALRNSDARLNQAAKMEAIGRLASGVAHDFNNLLMVIQTSVYMLEEGFDQDDHRRRETTEIQLATERAAKLTRQLLAMSRKSAVVSRPVLLDDLVAGLVPALDRLLGAGVKIELRRGGVPAVLADPGQLEQVVTNLAVNARDAMGGQGRLTIETSVERLDDETGALRGLGPGVYVALAVSDTGPGITPDVQKRIFEPFFTTKLVGEGTGLGLSIVHGIVEQAGGIIECYSELGYGTSFQIRLPACGEATVTATESAVSLAPLLQPVTVLLVEPQRELRDVMARHLAHYGCTVLKAGSCGEARELGVQHDGRIHAAVIELVLPDGRGDELARLLRELRPEIRPVLASGFPHGALGPTDASWPVLVKPFTPDQLRDGLAIATAPAAEVWSGESTSPRMDATVLPRILVVDDDPALRKMLLRFLGRVGFDVAEADTGRAGLAALTGGRVDVILSDVDMPDGDGLELLRAVRRVDLDLPVILMSGKPDVNAAASALEFGAFRYVTKPLELEAVERIVRQAVRAQALARIRREAFAVGGGHAGATDRAGLEVRFDAAIASLWMAYQPIMDARSGLLFGVEALMRSCEPSMPTPPAVLDAATELGRMPIVGRRVRDLAGTALAAREDIPQLFVNLHPSDLFDAHLVDETSKLTAIASRVVLEVTERESLEAGSALIERLARLRQLGFRLAVDDIGAGYSGLTSFADLTPEIVKIDMSLVRNVHTITIKQRTVRALCALCHDMGALVVGEGVETRDERDCLVELGCDLLQGYLLARPGDLAKVSSDRLKA